MTRLVVVAPLMEGAPTQAERLLEQGPPLDLERTSFDRHEVFLTDHEVVFLFEGPPGSVLELSGEDPTLWKAAAAWSKCLSGRPRVARSAFSWQRIEDRDGVSFAPTPGPGDSEGGELHSP